MRKNVVMMKIVVVAIVIFALTSVALPVGAAAELPGGFVTIKNWDQAHEAFSFSLGKVVSEGGDFFIADRGEDSIIHVFESPGIIDMGDIHLENIKEAPESGYEESAKPIEGHSYVMWSQGKYGKIRIEDIFSPEDYDWISVTEYEFEWVYQPDGTRSFGGGVAPTPTPTPTGSSDFGTTEILKKGFKGNIYYLEEGTSKLPDFSKMTPVGTIYTEKLDIPPRDFKQGFPGITDRFEWFGISYIGGIVIPSDGNYTFKLTSDDGAKLYIDDELVIDNDGIHPPRSKTKEVHLTKGDHLIGVDYFQGPRTRIALQLFVETSDGKETPVKPVLDPSKVGPPTPTPTPTPAWCDYFDSATLDPRWSWVREDPTHWSLTDHPGYLRITTQRGDLYQTNNDGKNLLLTPAPSGDFEVTTHVTIPPTANYHNAALFVYQDDDNYLDVARQYASMWGGQQVFLCKEVEGRSDAPHGVPCDLTTVYLKITKQNSTYTGYWSIDGSNWTKVYQYKDIKFSNLKIGFTACNGGSSAPEITADFDYICVAPVGAVPTPTPTPTPTPNGYSDFGTTEILKKGFKGNVYYLEEGTSKLPDFSKMTPVGTIYTEKLDIPPRDFKQGFPGITDRFEWFGISYIGGIVIPSDGNYTFKLTSDDGSKLYIDGELVIDNDGIHPPRTVTKEVHLSKGDHLIGVDYFQGPKVTIALQLFVETPEGKETPVKPVLDPSELEEPTPTPSPTQQLKISDLRGTLNTDNDCNLYVADYGNNQVKMINPDGSTTTYASGIDRPRYQVFDSAGNLYVGSFDGNIYKVSASGGKTVVASGIWSPQGMGFDSAGNLYVGGGYDGKIHRIAPDGSKTTMDSGFAHPKHLAVYSNGNIYVVDSGGTLIVMITPEGEKASLVDLGETILGMATDGEYLYVSHSDKISRIDTSGEVTHIATDLDQPTHLTVCNGNAFVTVSDGIVKLQISPVSSGDGEATLIEIAQVPGRNLAMDSFDNMYVSSYVEHKVVKVTPEGVVSDFATGISRAREGICDTADNLYVGDYNGHVWKITPAGSKAIIASGIWSIQGLALDNSGNLYVSSGYDDTIYKIDLSSGSKTVFSTALVSAATFPTKMAINQSTNDLYVSVSTNWPPSLPPGGPALSLIKITQADPSSYETIATLPGVSSGGAMHFNTNGNLLWSCLTRYVYNAAEGKWECARYESEILEVDLVTGALTEFLKEDGFLIEGMAFDSSNQFFIAGTWEITNEHFIYKVVQSPTPPTSEWKSGTIPSSQGGEVKLPDGASISIPPNTLDRDSVVTVRTVSDSPAPVNSNMQLGSHIYEFLVEGQDSFKTPVTITIPYQESELPSGASENDIKVAYYDDVAEDWVPHEGEVDTQRNLVLVSTTHLSLWTGFVDLFRTHFLETDNFNIEYVLSGPNAVPNEGYVQTIGSTLEDAKNRLQSMGFKTRGTVICKIYMPGGGVKTERHKVRVVLTDMGKLWGQACPSKLGDDFSYLKLHNNAPLEALKVTACHEYFHLCQSLYFTDLWWFKGPYVWLNEATALWFEDLSYPNNNGYRQLLNANNEFINEALDTNTQDHGYGAAAFVKYLSWKYGNEIVRKIYDNAATQSVGSRDAIKAIDGALSGHGTNIEKEFAAFADLHYTKRNYDEAQTWNPPPREKPSLLSAGNRQIKLQINLPPLSARAYRIGVNPKNPVEGEVTLNADFPSGVTSNQVVMVYAGKRKGLDVEGWPLVTQLRQDGETFIFPGFGEPLDKNTMHLVVINGDREKSFTGTITISMSELQFVIIEPLSRRCPEDPPILPGVDCFWERWGEVPAGGTATFQVKLSAKPSETVEATVSRVHGDPDITVASGSKLTFTPSNWNSYQTVTLAGAPVPTPIQPLIDVGEACIRIHCTSTDTISDKDVFVTLICREYQSNIGVPISSGELFKP